MILRRVVLGFVATACMAQPWPKGKPRPVIKPAPGDSVPFEQTFRACGKDWLELVAQARTESSFFVDVVYGPTVSSAGASGIFQWMPKSWDWAQDIGWAARGASPFDPGAAIPAGARYMRFLKARVAGDWHSALGGFNAGLLSVQRATRLSHQLGYTGRHAWLKALPHVTGVEHAAETAGYIARNDLFLAQYRAAGLK